MPQISGWRAALAIQDSLDRHGLVRTSTMNGGETAGWIALNRFGSTGFSLRPNKTGGIDWHIVISGEPHLTYREHKEFEGDEPVTLHSPTNPEIVYPKIRAAFAALGIEVVSVAYTGHQTMWDDDVDYDIVSTWPGWLEPHDERNRRFCDHRYWPSLESIRFTGPFYAKSRALPVYRTEEGRLLAPRETLEALAAYDEFGNAAPQKLTFNAAAGFDLSRVDGKVQPIAGHRQVITNRWGDDVEVWALPHTLKTQTNSRFRTDLPVLVGGERTTAVPFAVLDLQDGGQAPWTPDIAPAGMKP